MKIAHIFDCRLSLVYIQTANATGKTVARKHRNHTKNPKAPRRRLGIWNLGFEFWDFALNLPAWLLPSSTTAAPAAAAAPPTAAAPSTAAATEAAATPWRHRPSFVHGERTAAEALLVELRNRILRILVGRHFHECEAASAPGLTVPHDTDGRHRAGLRK
jgi:hypothetical protein